jgi:hypothetical protein
MSLSAMRLTLREGPRNDALPAPTVMTLRIEPSRRHGPFDPRWLPVRSLKDAAQPEEAWSGTAVEAWEGEGGALLREERPTNPKFPDSVSVHGLRKSAVRSGIRVSSG